MMGLIQNPTKTEILVASACFLGVAVWLAWYWISGRSSRPVRICKIHGGDSFARCERCRRVYCYQCWPDDGDCTPYLGDDAWRKDS